jgi:hypothetical protein
MSRGNLTVRIEKAEAIRLIGEKMREKREEFLARKKDHKQVVEQVRTQILAQMDKDRQRVAMAKTIEQLAAIAGEDIMDYSRRNRFPSDPELNLCREQQLLTMLKADVRKVIPLSSEHELWAIVQGKCKPER